MPSHPREVRGVDVLDDYSGGFPAPRIRRSDMPAFPAPTEGIRLTNFIVSGDIARSWRFYTEVLGGELVMEGEPSVVALVNGWIIINVGGGPTDDKPTVIL